MSESFELLSQRGRTYELTVNVTADRHRALDRLDVRLLNEHFPSLRNATQSALLPRDEGRAEETHLVTQPLYVGLCELLAVGKVRDPC